MNRAVFLSAALWLVLTANVFAAESPEDNGYYIGTLGRHPIVLVLGTDTPDSAALYRYLQYGPPISLTREAAGENELLLTEVGGKTGRDVARFKCRFDDERNLRGRWASIDGKRSFSINLRRIADQERYSVHEPLFSVDHSIPVFTAKTAFYQAVNARLTKSTADEVRTTANENRKERNNPLDESRIPWTDSATCEVLHADETMVSLQRQNETYSGGAHSNTTYSSLTYIWRNNRLVELKPTDLVSNGSTSLVRRLLVQDLERQKAGWAQSAAELNLGEAVANPTAGGLLFTFAPYEVDCYAAGSYCVMLSYASLADAIPPGSPLERFTSDSAASAR